MKIEKRKDELILSWEETEQAIREYIEARSGRKVSGGVYFERIELNLVGELTRCRTHARVSLEDVVTLPPEIK